jgi:hypothetical protein
MVMREQDIVGLEARYDANDHCNVPEYTDCPVMPCPDAGIVWCEATLEGFANLLAHPIAANPSGGCEDHLKQ